MLAGGFLHEEQEIQTWLSFIWNQRIGAFQGNVSPISSKSVLETCVKPFLDLLYGAENWIATDHERLIERFEAFQARVSL